MTDSDSRLRVLVVDDDPAVLRLLSLILTSAGYEVATCASTTEAWKRLETDRFSLLITDLRMPGGTGLDLARDLRASKNRVPILLLSASLDEETRRAAAELGRMDCANKPLDHQHLLGLVRTLIGSEEAS